LCGSIWTRDIERGEQLAAVSRRHIVGEPTPRSRRTFRSAVQVERDRATTGSPAPALPELKTIIVYKDKDRV
jgi:hypothetical protein